MTYTISRDYRGTHAIARPGAQLGKEVASTFQYAVGCFGYLLNLNETISLEDWRWRIAKHCAPSPRIIRVLAAIDAARGAA